jgi:hypothetical protein
MDWRYLWSVVSGVFCSTRAIPAYVGLASLILRLFPAKEGGRMTLIIQSVRDHPAFVCMSFLMVSVVLVSHNLYVNKRPNFATPDELIPSILQNKAFRLVDLTRESLVIQGRTFENCDIYGPAVVFQVNCHFEKVTMAAPSRESVAIETDNTIASGAIRLDTCVIKNCRFYRIGFIGSKEQLAAMRAQIIEKDK